MAKKKSDIKTASAYFEISFFYPIKPKRTSEFVNILKKVSDKVDILTKNPNPLKLGVMVHGIYYSDGMLDHEINKLESEINQALHINTLSKRSYYISKRKAFAI